MSCSVKEIRDKSFKKMYEVYNQTKTVEIENDTVIITPSTKSKLVNNKKRAISLAKRGAEKIEAWARDTFGPAFSTGWTSIYTGGTDNNPNVVTVKLTFPKNLEKAYEEKIEAENRQRFEDENNLGEEVKYSKSRAGGSPDTNIRGKYFNNGQANTTRAVLRDIAYSDHPLAKLAKRLDNHVKHNNITIVLKPVDGFEMFKGDLEKQSRAFYNPNTNTIEIAEFANFPAGQSEAIILHEILHSISHQKLRDNSTVSQDFNKIYEVAVKHLGTELYAMSDIDEFMVGLFTDSRLVIALKDIPPTASNGKYKNLFQEVFDWILRLVNIGKTSSLYEEAFSIATNILEDKKEAMDAYVESLKYDDYFEPVHSMDTGTYGESIEGGSMPFQIETIDKMNAGDQKVTIRRKSHPTGIYTIGKTEYHILNLGRKNISNFTNPGALKKKFKGDDYTKGKFIHIDRFFEGKQNLFVYQITKLDETTKKKDVNIDSNLNVKPGEEGTASSEYVKPAFERQYVFFKRKLNQLEKELNALDSGTDEYTIKEAELKSMQDRFEKATEEKDKAAYAEMANEYLDWVEELINSLPETPTLHTLRQLTDAFEIINAFPANEFTELKARAETLREGLFPYVEKHNLFTVNKYDNSPVTITKEMIDEQDKDIRWSSKSFGSLSDVANFIGRTIGSVIKAAQNRASTHNKQFEAVVQGKVDRLVEYSKNNNISMEQVYDIFLQESKTGSLVLTQRYDREGNENPNYDVIENSPELKEFYDFYKDAIKIASSNLPYKVDKHYVLNKIKSGKAFDLRKIIPVNEVTLDGFVSNEELVADIVPEQYRNDIPASKKSRDLGSGLLEFVAYSNNYNELSNALPEVRLLQESLKYTRDTDGNIVEKQYIDPSNPKNKRNAEESNIFNMVKTVIDMQVKGKMTSDKMTSIKYNIKKDADGNIISYKEIKIEAILDRMLRYNSLLRIGLSPVTAITNVLFGDISNLIEAVGGRHFNVREMNSATNIFRKQLQYTKQKNPSNMYKWLERLNPLQELADYDLGANLQANPKKLTPEKAMEIMYSMQRNGELYLQSRTMLAMLIHDGYMNPDGTNTNKVMTDEQAVQMSDKIQRINQMIHGRYSQREAATMQQSVWFRAAIQFRKWIPAAIEQRFGDAKFDNRLQVDVEGRYRSGLRNIVEAGSVSQAFENLFLPILNSKAALERGNMTETEIYNMRKNMMELILLTATVLLYAGLKGDDDDKEWRKNPYVKFGLTTLNRISGDLLFFYDLGSVSKIGSKIAPVTKLMDDIIKVTKTLPHALYLGDYEIKRGSLKGKNDFYFKNLPKIIPGFIHVSNLQKIWSDDVLPEFQ